MIISAAQVRSVLRAYGKQPAAAPAPTQAAKAAKASDRVHLSAQAKELAVLRARLRGVPDVRADRVAELREAIRSGKYRPSALEIADKMLGRLLADQLSSRADE